MGIWLALAATARADDATPQTSPPTAVAIQPTVPPVVDTVPTSSAPAAVDSTPIAPAKEYNQPTPSVPDSNTVPTALATAPARYETGPTSPGVTLNPNPQPRQLTPTSNSPSASAQGNGNGTASGPPSLSGVAPPADVSSITSPYVSVSAQAPSQLTCRGKQHGTALPFLVSPYSGWTEFVSFVDHDSPDYTVDGTIVLANGITATSGDGQESDLWPAYWSPSLRQFVNYDGHNGYDFALSYQPVLAAGTGTVSFAGWNSSDQYAGYGQMVLIDHHNGYVTLYGHLSSVEVKQGDKVTAGQEIGISGTTGHSSGPHLHFSVFHNCHVTDPYGWTGQGTDPLYTFDGEHASYLWLPGRDPLVVNPPRGWPTFPLGLHLALSSAGSGQSLASSVGTLRTPAIQRLLLLDLPESHSVGTSSPAVALARTEASITQEAEAIAPALDDLKGQGLVQQFQVIPAAAAVWLRGTASAAQLLSLPGVASLAGVQPQDLTAAQTGLSHDVLIQIQHQQAPSLWPLGFRSALHPWRPMMTVVIRHALVTGVALPGQQVALTLRRDGRIVGLAEATADVNSGGFVAMLHDLAGNPVETQAGDIVSIQSGGKTDSMRIVPFSIRARSGSISGVAVGGASIPLALTRVGGTATGSAVVTTPASGAFSLLASHVSGEASLGAGELAVGTVANSAGDEEAASAFVPGAQIFEGSALVRGWTVGYAPRLVLVRRHRILISTRIHSAPDGTFQLELHRGKQMLSLAKGDVVRIGSQRHPRVVTLPGLNLVLQSGAHEVRFRGPANARVALTVTRANGHTTIAALQTDDQGVSAVSVRGGPLALGDGASLTLVTRTGDQIYVRGQARGILIRIGSAVVSGTVQPGAVLSIHALSARGSELAGAVASANLVSGAFRVELRTKGGKKMRLRAGMELLVRDGTLVTSTTVPVLTASRRGKTVLSSATVSPRQAVTWTGMSTSGDSTVRQLRANSHGALLDRYALSNSSSLKRVFLRTTLGQGVTVEAALAFIKRSGTTVLHLSRGAAASCTTIHQVKRQKVSAAATPCTHSKPVSR